MRSDLLKAQALVLKRAEQNQSVAPLVLLLELKAQGLEALAQEQVVLG